MTAFVSSPPRYRNARPIFWQGRRIGELTPEGVWLKAVRSKRQWCHKHDAPGVQAKVFDDLHSRGLLRGLEVRDKTTGCTLRLPADEFARLSIRDTLAEADGEQLFVARSHWHAEYAGGQLSLVLTAETA